jgi:ABC-2 type transport system permease protein
MNGIFKSKLQLFARNPWGLIIITVVCVMFAYFLGKGSESSIFVPVSSTMPNSESNQILNELNKNKAYTFSLLPNKEVKRMVSGGEAEVGVEIKKDTYTLLVTTSSPNQALIRQEVETVYQNRLKVKKLSQVAPNNMKEKDIEQLLINADSSPLFNVKQKSFRGNGAFVYDSKIQALFGFSLFFVVFTISFNVVQILKEKKQGVWDRMILSPIRKWEMYTANLLYAFLIGYVQVLLVFIVFRYFAGVNFHGAFGLTMLLLIPYVFSIVALSMCLIAVTKNIPQYNAIVPLISVSMAMLGGAYWPLEIVKSPILLALSKVIPITYGIQAMKGAVLYGYSLTDLAYPIGILFLMGVIMMGVGINLMEKRHI